ARASVVAAAIAIRLDHAAHPDTPCFVFASVVPQIMWYAACDGKPKHLFDRVHDLPGAPGARYLASTSYGAADGAAFAAAHGLTARELPTLHPRTRVWALH
ncbi:MAG TPA: hypothetical protein VFP84_30500, partial [Kofleriaceae bacterium]|nr:hypothetical protein [Kofleriaceae bacterium]